MNTEQLRAALKATQKTITVPVPDVGEFKLRTIGARDGVVVSKKAAKFLGSETPEDMADFWIDLLQLSMIDDDGNLAFNDDEGRAILAGMRLDALTILGNAAVELNGMSAKKNEN